jgi:putative ATP-dependent endonuclease of the OLD family
VACIADADVMPACAPEIVGKVNAGEDWPQGRRWKVESDFGVGELDQHKQAIRERASGQNVETFVSDNWTLEYDLAHAGLGRDLFLAIALAKKDEDITSGSATAIGVTKQALKDWKTFTDVAMQDDERAAKIYAPLAKGLVSKSVTAQYLARILMRIGRSHKRTPEEWKEILPNYIVDAIEFVTASPPAVDTVQVAQDQPQE